MPYDRPHVYLTWGGTIGDSDVWQCGLHLAAVTAAAVVTQPTVAQLQDLFEDTIAPMHSAGDSYINQGARLAWVKAAHLDTAGAYTSDESYYEPAASIPGASTAAASAPQVALAVTLFSGSAFGQANYGRFYLPWSDAPVDFLFAAINDTERAGITARMAEFLNEVNAWASALPTDLQVSNLSPVGAGTTKRVNIVRVGSVKDTQRRRRNRLTEEYSNITLAP